MKSAARILVLSLLASLAALSIFQCGREGQQAVQGRRPAKATAVEPVRVSADNEVKIGVILTSETDDFDDSLRQNIVQQVARYGSRAFSLASGSAPQKHRECVQKLVVEEGVHVLIADSPTVESFDEMAAIAATRGTYIINTGTQKTIQRQPLVVQFIGKDNTEGGYKIGSETGRLIAESFDGKGKVIIIDMPAEKVKYQDRAGSFRNGLTQYAYESEIVAVVQGSESIEDSQRIVAEALQEHPEANVIYSVCKESTLGAIKACSAAKKEPRGFAITGYDSTREIFESIKTGGFVRAVVVDQPAEIARVMVQAAMDLATGKRELKEYQSQSHWILTVLVRKDNVDQWI